MIRPLAALVRSVGARVLRLRARRFREVGRDPGPAQRRVLERLLAAQAGTRFLQAHGRPRTRQAYRDQVPLHDYESLRPWVDRARAGEPGVLTADPVLWYEATSGTTGRPKWIPFTSGSLSEIHAAIGPWLGDLLEAHPGLVHKAVYLSISPVAPFGEHGSPGREERPVPGTDADYLPRLMGSILASSLAVPFSVRHAKDLTAWRSATLAHLLGREDLGAVSVWSPSFLTILLDAVPALFPGFADRLPGARRRQLESVLGSGEPPTARALWPQLELVSCWASGPARFEADRLAARLGPVPIQPKGLLSTEGVVTIPMTGLPGGVPALESHHLEFIPGSSGETSLLEEIEEGGTYEVVLTTGAGLHRYRTGDRVRVVGRHGRTPLLEFVGRVGRISDLVGEKLHEADVDRALAGVRDRLLFVLVVPEARGAPRYRILLEPSTALDPGRVAREVDDSLRTNPHYALARDLGQLAPVEPLLVRDGHARYLDACSRQGTELGAVKPTAFEPRVEVSARMIAAAAPVAPPPPGDRPVVPAAGAKEPVVE